MVAAAAVMMAAAVTMAAAIVLVAVPAEGGAGGDMSGAGTAGCEVHPFGNISEVEVRSCPPLPPLSHGQFVQAVVVVGL